MSKQYNMRTQSVDALDEEEIRKEMMNATADIALAESMLEKVGSDMNANAKLWTEKTEDLKRQLREAETPFIARRGELSERKKMLEDGIRYKEVLKRELVALMRLAKDKHLQNFNAEAFGAFLMSIGINPETIEQVGQEMANGIRVFRRYEHYDHKASEAKSMDYYAVRAKKIIGFAAVDKSQHPGDESHYTAWINQPDLTNETIEAVWDVHNIALPEYGSWKALRFKEWKAKLETLLSFVAVDLSNDSNIRILKDIGTSWSQYRNTPWPKDDKAVWRLPE